MDEVFFLPVEDAKFVDFWGLVDRALTACASLCSSLVFDYPYEHAWTCFAGHQRMP